ncbi:MAG: metallophosphoesterase family protein [Saprospiraceae bacterium]|nr:metallophosphoesterase family protein [Saprospiraceae bacterium]
MDKKMNNEWRVQELGARSGKMLVFGGVYSNWPALERLMALAREWGIPSENILCTGDIVGYCAEPEACVQAIRDWGIHAIAGNVEIQLREGETDCGCNFNEGSRCDLFSRQWYPYAQSQLSPAAIGWMQGLPDHLAFQYAGQRLYVLHGSYFNTSEFVFRSTPWAQKAPNFEASGAGVLLAGHCGLPFHHEEAGRLWLNAGVIGMPANDGTPRVWCLLLDEAGGQLRYQHYAFGYDHERAARAMEQQGLPCEYSGTLRSGLWDNCEILPPAETATQGQALGG